MEPTPTHNLQLMPDGNGNVSVSEVNNKAEAEARKRRPTLSAPLSDAFNTAWSDYIATQNVGRGKDRPLLSSAELLRTIVAQHIKFDMQSDPEVLKAKRTFVNAEARKAAQAKDREQKKLANKAIDNLKDNINKPGVDKMQALLDLAKQLGIDVSKL